MHAECKARKIQIQFRIQIVNSKFKLNGSGSHRDDYSLPKAVVMSILPWIVPALVLAGAAPASAQVSLILGASAMKGRLQTPYAGRECALDMKTEAAGAVL